MLDNTLVGILSDHLARLDPERAASQSMSEVIWRSLGGEQSILCFKGRGIAMRVLLVDDEPRLVEALERLLGETIDDLEIETALSGADALSLLEDAPFDLIISDMRMPFMDGAELLGRVHARWPSTVRFILSGQMDKLSAMRALPHTHQFLTKPCPVDTMRAAIESAISVRILVTDPVVREIAGEIGILTLRGGNRQFGAPIAGPEELSSRDPAFAARVLQLANSSCFAEGSPVYDIKMATAKLGSEVMSALALANTLARCELPAGFDIARFEQQSIMCGFQCQASRPSKEAFAAGLLSRLGVLLIAVQRPEVWRKIEAESKGKCRVVSETALIGTTHTRIGAYLLGLWGLPASIVNAVAFQDDPDSAPPKDRPLTLSLAFAIAATYGGCASPECHTHPQLDPNALHDRGCSLCTWRCS